MNASELLPADFNAATWFVDRNVAEGRGAAPAFHYEGRTLTYADVQELVDRRSPGAYLSYDERIAKASTKLVAATTSRDDPAYWQYSSGSTGFPKGAVHLHHDMVICCETYAKQVLGIRPTDRVFSAAKLFFAYGLGATGFMPMSVGAQAMLYPHRPTPEGVFEAITRFRPTIFFGVPTLYARRLA